MPNERLRLPVIQRGETSTDPPVFEKIAIVGLGLIGGSIALAAREAWSKCLVIGIDDKAVLEKAMVLHAIDVASDDPVVMAEADLVVLAAPVSRNLQLLSEVQQHVTGNAVVTDVGSTKRNIVATACELPKRLVFIGGHPLGGAPLSGIKHARPELFRGRPWLFTPTDEGHNETLQRLEQFVKGLGAVPHVMSADEHDRLLAFLSHIPQITVSALMHVVGEAVGPSGLALAGRGLADTTRLASSPSGIWQDICSANADEIKQAIEELIETLGILRDDLSHGSEVDRIFRSAANWRSVLADQKENARKA